MDGGWTIAKIHGCRDAGRQKSTLLEVAGDAVCVVTCRAEGGVVADSEARARAAIDGAASKVLTQAQSLAAVRSQM